LQKLVVFGEIGYVCIAYDVELWYAQNATRRDVVGNEALALFDEKEMERTF